MSSSENLVKEEDSHQIVESDEEEQITPQLQKQEIPVQLPPPKKYEPPKSEAIQYDDDINEFDDEAAVYSAELPAPQVNKKPESLDGDDRTLRFDLGKKRVFLGLQQPLYKNIDSQPAKILKCLNIVAAVLKHNTSGCKGDEEGDFEKINCEFILQYSTAPNDGFPNFVVAMFICFYAYVTFMEEVYEKHVINLMGHLSCLSTLWGRGLFYLFMSSVIMTHAHTLLMLTSSLVMALAFLYIILYLTVEFTTYGDYLGLHGGSNTITMEQLDQEVALKGGSRA